MKDEIIDIPPGKKGNSFRISACIDEVTYYFFVQKETLKIAVDSRLIDSDIVDKYNENNFLIIWSKVDSSEINRPFLIFELIEKIIDKEEKWLLDLRSFVESIVEEAKERLKNQ